MNSKQEQMWENLRDKDFRKQFINEHVNVGIAFQIRSLRNRQQLKQSELAQLMDVKQPLISSWENPNYGKYSLQTLKDLATAFDVGLLVRFVPFGKLIDWTVDLKPDDIAPANYSEELSQNALWTFVNAALNANQGYSSSGLDANQALKPEEPKPTGSEVPNHA
jgi:transcriptional regulator with XRE-family HTH domain